MRPIVPAEPGIYVVELFNDHPISVNADRPSIADRCIQVTRANCKYGKAVNLARRERDYIKTFGAGNVAFRWFVVTQFHATIEAQLNERLLPYRIAGPSGRRNEWLQGLPVDALERLVCETVEQVERAMSATSHPRPPAPAHPGPPVVDSLPTGHLSPLALVAAARYLQAQGMTVEQLRVLHHFESRTETFTSTIRYFTDKRELRGNNLVYGARLIWVADAHRQTGASFDRLVRQAVQAHPR